MTSRPALVLAATILTGLLATANAGVYKCVGPDGSLTYSQTPCPGQKSTEVKTSSSSQATDSLDCRHAGQFALTVAQSMKRGRGSADVFNQYGGLDGLSKSAVNIVNYVYMFQHSSDLSADRIAVLTGNKCKARAFGDASCEAMPYSFIESIGGCGDNEDDEDDEQQTSAATVNNAQLQSETLASATTAESNRQARPRVDEDQSPDCKERLQKQIDNINSSMRSGYSSQQGERYRDRLRTLRDQMSDC